MTLMLAAQEMGYASYPMNGFDFGTVAKLIKPKKRFFRLFVAIDGRIKEAWSHGG